MNATLVDQIQGLADVLAFDQERGAEQRALALTRALNRVQGRMAMVRGLGKGLAVLLTSLAALTVLWLAIPLVSGGRLDGVFLALLPLAAIAAFEAVQPLAGDAVAGVRPGRGAAAVRADRRARPRSSSRRRQSHPPTRPRDLAVRHRGRTRPQPYRATTAWRLTGCASPTRPASRRFWRGWTCPCPRAGARGGGGERVGKTTLVNLLVRFWDYREGQIRMGGRELRTGRPKKCAAC